MSHPAMNHPTPSSTRPAHRAPHFRPPFILLGLALLGLAASAHPAAAQDAPTADIPAAEETIGELVTDRPDRTESAAVVPRGFVQLETGALFVRDDDGPVEIETLEAPGTLVRIGLGEALGRPLELRLGWTGWVREEASFARPGRDLEATVDGAGDAELGFKLGLWEGDGTRVALLAGTSLPTGVGELVDAGLASDDLEPSVLVAVSRDLSPRWSLGVNLGAGWESVPADSVAENGGTGDDLEAQGLYSVALGVGLTERLGAFVEVFGGVALDGGDDAHGLDGGLTYLLQPNLQLDLYAGVGLSDAADDRFVGFGVSWRLPR